MPNWPPPFSFRRSQRAKRLALRLDPERGLEVVLPGKLSEKKGLAFLESQRAWVERNLPRLNLANPLAAVDPPSCIHLACVDQSIPVDYISIVNAKKTTFLARDDRLVFYGDVSDFRPCVPYLIDWLKQQAKRRLPPLLNDLSETCQLPYRKVGVRQQKTLWGSCNSDKDIQLNYKLLLLPADLARYVMIHELCHTVHMNHSQAFWRLVETHLPDYREQERALKHASALLPGWLFLR